MRSWILFFGLLVLSTTAYADPVKDKLDSLETTIKQMQTDSIQRNEKVASALATMEQLKQDFRLISGQLDADAHMIQEQAAEISRLKRDLSDRLLSIEEKLDIYDKQISKAVAKVVPQAAHEAEAYQKALDLVQKSDFLTAVASFRSFIKSYPKSDMLGNAQFWIGECYYALKDFPKAIKEFQAVVDKYANSPKVPAAMLKQGFSFAEMGMLDEAKLFLDKLIKTYPNSDEARSAKEKITRIEQKEAQPSPVPPTDATRNIPLAPGVKIPQTESPQPADKKY